MGTQVWIAVVAWAAVLSAAVGQAGAQSKCPGETPRRCVSCAQWDTSKPRGVKDVCECRIACQKANVGPASPVCGPKTAGKDNSDCGVQHSQKGGIRVPDKGPVKAEPRKLALPHGSYRRLRVGEPSKAGSECSCKECRACLVDTRHEAIFGTDTILGDFAADLFRDGPPCPYEHPRAGRPNTLGQALSRFDASLQKVFGCQRERCSDSRGKGAGGAKFAGKGDCPCTLETPPNLEGPPEEPELKGNPFRDDALEPAPLPPTPRMTPTASSTSRNGERQPPSRLGVAQARPISAPAPVPAPQSRSSAASEQRSNRVSLLERMFPGSGTGAH